MEMELPDEPQPTKFEELACVKAAHDMGAVPAGSLGVVVYHYVEVPNPDWYEVEFDGGHILTCHNDDLEAV